MTWLTSDFYLCHLIMTWMTSLELVHTNIVYMDCDVFLGANKSSSVWACTKSFMFYTLCHTGTVYMQQTSWNLIFKKFVCSSSTKNLEKSPSILSHAWFSTSSWTCFDFKFIFDIHLFMSMRKSIWNRDFKLIEYNNATRVHR